MADYENRPVPEGINYSRENPLKEFLLLCVALAGALAVLLFSLSLAAQKLAPLIPFSVENRLVEQFSSSLPAPAESERAQKIDAYLSELAESLLSGQKLPEGFNLQVAYVDSPMTNAFATLGGRVFIMKGLIQEMGSENALSMVLAHELAHILNRDPIVAMGRGVTVSLALASLTGLGNSGAADWLIQQMGVATLSGFTREQERDADAMALKMLQARYGNVQGADQIFTLFEGGEPPELFSTHPLSSKRISAVREFAATHPQAGNAVPLPAFLHEQEAGE
ncbi:putative Zn-dependent protease [Litorivivens lipolytica]|uniref:Putative Zn-dependent protease n=1 Tax=Litorivivens lipolytica TaxID=1524264 RepID=A0A7W4W6N3_9GAMM|nr:M48 family metallopeptidase [Litorivivens lipolytica]MBB3048442.1 putative Zn-dependent protease [Litorivivens lipolytica]